MSDGHRDHDGHDGPLGHVGIAGREPQMEALASAVRRLIALAVTTAVPPDELEVVTGSLHELCDRLEVDLPAVSYPRFTSRDPSELVDADRIETALPFDVVVGKYNPIALPVKMEIAPPVAIGRAVFTTPYEGAPGCVHGASIAGAFDIVLTAANMIAGAAGPTVRLALRFRRPTLLDRESVFEAEVDRMTEKRVYTSGRLVQDGVVTVEATGEFALLDREQIASMHRR